MLPLLNRRCAPPHQRPSHVRGRLRGPSKLRNVITVSPPRSTSPQRTSRCRIGRFLNPPTTPSCEPTVASLVSPIPPAPAPRAARDYGPPESPKIDARPPSHREGVSAPVVACGVAHGDVWTDEDEKERLEIEYAAAIIMSLQKGLWGRAGDEGNASTVSTGEQKKPARRSGRGETTKAGGEGTTTVGIRSKVAKRVGMRSRVAKEEKGDVESIRSRMRMDRFLTDG